MAPIFNTVAPKCANCNQSVYHAEQVLCLGKIYHKPCLKCTSCNNRVDLGSVLDHDSLPYCKTCHSRNFGIKGYGNGGALVGTYNSPSPSSSPIKPSSPFTPTTSRPLPTTTTFNSPLSTSPSINNARIQSSNSISSSIASPSSINNYNSTSPSNNSSNSSNNMNQCPKCSKTVYFAEKVLAIGRNWHKSCLRCESCNNSLTSSSLNDRDGKPYCKNCYTTQFGNMSPGIMRRAGI